MAKANILTCHYNFYEPWCRPALAPLLQPGLRVTVVPFSFPPAQIADAAGWEHEFGPGGRHRRDLEAAFAPFGITELCFVNYFTHTPAEALTMVQGADLVFFTGGLPDAAMERVREFGLQEALETFPGILMGTSAGAMMQIDDYHISPDEDYPVYQRSRGLHCGLRFDVEVHYAFSAVQNAGIRRALQERAVPVWAIENTGALLVQDGTVTPLGDCHLIRSAADIPADRVQPGSL